MFGALKRGRFRSLASLILVVNVVGELQRKRTLAALRGFLAAARLSCFSFVAIRISLSLGLIIFTVFLLTFSFIIFIYCRLCIITADKLHQY